MSSSQEKDQASGFIAQMYPKELTTPLLTDKYHFTTAYAYFREGRADNPATFYMFGRKEALGGGYSVAAGLEGIIDIVKRWQQYGFLDSDIEFLRAQKTPSGKQLFAEDFLAYLRTMEFKLKIEAAPEGTLFFPQEPVLRVSGPIAQVKMLESIALGLFNGHSGYATQGARQAAVLEEELENGSPTASPSVQSLRRGPSLGAAIESSRSLGLGGYTSSSTGTAAKEFAQSFAGTMDHAWVMTHEHEVGALTMQDLYTLEAEGRIDELHAALKKDAFRSFAMTFPESGILLVDTYDPLQGLENAIKVIKELHALGTGQGYGVRFDSGDIVKYSKIALRRFAEEGFVEGLDPAHAAGMTDAELLKLSDKCKVFCAAADGIDEHSAQEMRAQGAFFKAYGIGTSAAHIAPLGLVYKASSVYMDALDGKDLPDDALMTPVMKVASNAPVKSSNPGIINSRRYYDADGMLSHVVIYDETLGLDPQRRMVNLRDFNDQREMTGVYAAEDILKPIFDQNGAYVYAEPPKKETFTGSGRFTTDLASINKKVKQSLKTLREDVRRVVRSREELLKKKLFSAFNEAKKSGNANLSLDIAALETSLPPDVGHVPVFIDQKLFEQRRECERKHAIQATSTGVGEYRERFESIEAPPAKKMGKKALLIVDLQNGFCPGGNLAVPEGDQIVPIVNRLIEKGGYDLIVASQDWHPADHSSFASQHPGKQAFEMGTLSGQPQVMWPDHCVQDTKDAEFHPGLNVSAIDYIQKKGMDSSVDSYSAFRDNGRDKLTGLAEYLKREGITELHVCGLATEVCVKFSVLDALEMLPGVKVVFIDDASRGLSKEAVSQARADIAAAGGLIRQSADLLPLPAIAAGAPNPIRRRM